MRIVFIAVFYFAHFAVSEEVTTDKPTATTTAISTLDAGSYRRGRGMMMDYDDHHDYIVDHPPENHKPMMKDEQKAVKTDPWAGYYDFIINEGSFKFWAAFQLGTALLLTYSAFAAIYYAKFNPIGADYDYYDEFFFRSNGRSADTSSSWSSWFGLDANKIKQILNAITSKKYT